MMNSPSIRIQWGVVEKKRNVHETCFIIITTIISVFFLPSPSSTQKNARNFTKSLHNTAVMEMFFNSNEFFYSLSLSAPPDLSHSHSALHIWVHIKIDFHRTCHLNIWNVSGNMKSTNQNKHSSDMCSVRCMDVVCASDAVSDPESYARFFNLCVWQSQNRLVSSGSATDDGEHTYVLLSSSSLSYKYFVWVKARQGEQQIYFADAEIHEWIVHPAEAQWESWSIWFSRFSTEYHRI